MAVEYRKTYAWVLKYSCIYSSKQNPSISMIYGCGIPKNICVGTYCLLLKRIRLNFKTKFYTIKIMECKGKPN